VVVAVADDAVGIKLADDEDHLWIEDHCNLEKHEAVPLENTPCALALPSLQVVAYSEDVVALDGDYVSDDRKDWGASWGGVPCENDFPVLQQETAMGRACFGLQEVPMDDSSTLEDPSMLALQLAWRIRPLPCL